MSNELVKNGLENWIARIDRGWTIPPDELKRGLTDAIAFISSHDSVRDRVLEEAVQAVVHCNTSKIGAASAIRALKAKPFTRTDGTTSPERGTVADRRKQACSSGAGRNREIPYGRRSNDRARWTAAPVVEELGKQYRSVEDVPSLSKVVVDHFATQPAQEAPQPEKTGLEAMEGLDPWKESVQEWVEYSQKRGDPSDYTLAVMANSIDHKLAALRRQGAK